MAERVDESGGEYWYIPEILEFEAETDAVIEEACKDNGNYNNCRTLQAIQLFNTYGYKYKAVWQLKHQNFILTAINPYRGTIRAYYNGLNSQSQEKADISELYIYWVEEGRTDPQSDYSLARIYAEQIENGTAEDYIHPILIKNGTETGWMTTGEEARFVIPSNDLLANPQHKIFFTTINTVGDIYSGFLNYSDCLSSINREDGLECRGVYYFINETYTYLFDTYPETLEDKELPLREQPPTTYDTDEPEISIDEPKRYWLAEELIQSSDTIREGELACGNDIECRQNVFDEYMIEYPEKFQAVDDFSNARFVITAVNPTQGKVKAIYRDRLAFTYLMEDDESFINPIEELILGWSALPENASNLEEASNLDPDFQFIIDHRGKIPLGWLPSDTEIEFTAKDGLIIDAPNHRIYYEVSYNNGGSGESWFYDYGACLDSELYEDGMECQLSIDEYGVWEFVPTEPRDGALAFTEIQSEDGTSTTGGVGSEGTNEDITDADSFHDVDLATAQFQPQIKTPNTGAKTKNPRKNDSSPWWQIAVATSAMVVLWFLLPSRKKSQKKC